MGTPPGTPAFTTGAVFGEFGMAEAYERKRREVLGWLEDPDEKVREFARWYMQGLEKMSSNVYTKGWVNSPSATRGCGQNLGRV
jgi:hypothetical protein